MARVRIVRELGARAPGTYLGHRDDASDEGEDVVLETYASLEPGAMARVAELARKLRDAPPHPHVVRVLSAERIGEGLSVVTDFVDGIPLGDVFFGLSLGGRLRAVVDVLAALSAMHGAGVVHGGVLRGSSFVETTGRTKLGFAYRQPLCVRKETYAPEALLGDESAIDARSDVYGAGVMLWEAVTGRVLFGNEPPERIVERQLAGRVDKALPTKSDRWARTLLPVVERALAVDPKERYASVAEMAAAVRIAVRARLMMHEDVVEEIWPAETKPNVTSGVQPAARAAPLVAEAAPQTASEPPPEPVAPESVAPPPPLTMEPEALEEGAASGVVPVEPMREPMQAVFVAKRRSSWRSIVLLNVALVLVVAGVAALTLHVRAPAAPTVARPDLPAANPAARPPSIALAPAVSASPAASASTAPAASDRAPARPAHKSGRHAARSAKAYDPGEI